MLTVVTISIKDYDLFPELIPFNSQEINFDYFNSFLFISQLSQIGQTFIHVYEKVV